jgi:hypothetical protein
MPDLLGRAAFSVGFAERLVSRLRLSPAEHYPTLLASSSPNSLARVPQHYIAHFLGLPP